MPEAPIKLAVVDGFHPYDIANFHKMFRSMPDVDPYHQFFENWGVNGPDAYRQYDAMIFYNMTMSMEEGFRPGVENSIERLADKGTPGVVLWHHAILSLPDFKPLSDAVGIPKRTFGFHLGQKFTVNVVDKEHPITRGLDDWEMTDETYTMDDPKDADGNHVLLKVNHDPSMECIAWTRMLGKTRVFCFQSGHDNETWSNPNFRTVLHRGIQWAAGRI